MSIIEKRTICFVGWDKQVCLDVAIQLHEMLGQYVHCVSWCLHELPVCPDLGSGAVFIASVPSVADYIQHKIPPNAHLITAERALNIKKIIKLQELPEDATILVMSASQLGAMTTIRLISQLKLHKLQMIPYYPGSNDSVLSGITTAVITGQDIEIPRTITKTIDLGSKGINFSTIIQLCHLIPKIPITLIDKLAQSYIGEIFLAGVEQYHISQMNLSLIERTNTILDTVDDAVIAVDQSDMITAFNRKAEELLSLSARQAIGLSVFTVFPEFSAIGSLQLNSVVENKICRIRNEDFILNSKPISGNLHDGYVLTLRHTEEILRIEENMRKNYIAKGYQAHYTFHDILGSSPALLSAKEKAQHFASTTLPILLQADTGSGKELFAQAIHNASPRRNKTFVAINFAALSENLADSELFGYEEGSFTGAKKGGSIGLLEQADKGTIFLDEIGDAPLSIQKKLLRALENHEIRRIGGDRIIHIDVRIIAATNRNLSQMILDGTFRSDLYYRLAVLPVRIPALRDRSEDILMLMEHSLSQNDSRNVCLSCELQKYLLRYGWPGNVRELNNICLYLRSMLPHGGTAQPEMLPEYMNDASALFPVQEAASALAREDVLPSDKIFRELEVSGLIDEALAILKNLEQAELLGCRIGRGELLRRMQAQGIKTSEHRIKKLINHFESLGYCQSGSTKQGTYILPEGKAFIKYCQ